MAERHKEKLGTSDKGIILYRRLLKDQMELAQDGGDPMNVFRDPAKNEYLEFPRESSFNASSARRSRWGFGTTERASAPCWSRSRDLYGKVAEAAEGNPALAPAATATPAELCRRHEISPATFYNWKARFGGTGVSEARRLRQLDEENRKLKQLLAEATSDNHALRELLRTNA